MVQYFQKTIQAVQLDEKQRMRDQYHLACFVSGIFQIMPSLLPKEPYWKVLAVSC